MIEKRQRKSIRLKEYDYSQPGEYFVTICTQNHECVFGSIVNGEMNMNEKGRIVNRCWRGIPEHFSNAVLDEYKKKMPRKAGQHSQASGCRTTCMELLIFTNMITMVGARLPRPYQATQFRPYAIRLWEKLLRILNTNPQN
jgi:hypothetical protein